MMISEGHKVGCNNNTSEFQICVPTLPTASHSRARQNETGIPASPVVHTPHLYAEPCAHEPDCRCRAEAGGKGGGGAQAQRRAAFQVSFDTVFAPRRARMQ